ncbi:MAG TPA: 30S ribosomal protein S8 [Candidatus Saccharibacteria bacterium]|nr:30S ribosomal protein S8 [Candidatus Saccharibacteria bacterium]HMT39591.1 30S ribosomal protein S8 [Candidatus Saccharibacteria bacterium]
MMTTDPIADMLTRIRNGLSADKSSVIVPHSKIKLAIAQILKSNGYLTDVKETKNGAFMMLELALAGSDKKITTITRMSKPGRRMYAPKTEIPSVLGGRGIVIVSTPSGIMTGSEARKKGVGGELICTVY